MTNWKFASIIEVDKEYKVEGINIWNHYWHCSGRCVEVFGPFEGNTYCFKEYEIRTDNQNTKFVVGEFSNGKIGLYVKDDLSGDKL